MRHEAKRECQGKETDTILEKFEKLEKGEEKLLGWWRRGGSIAKEGRPGPRPAPCAPPADGPWMSLRVKLGLSLGRMRGGGMGGSGAMEARCRAAVVSSKEGG